MREHLTTIRLRNFATHWDQKEKREYLTINGYDKTIDCYANSVIQQARNIERIFGKDNIDGLLLEVRVYQMRDGLIVHKLSVIME